MTNGTAWVAVATRPLADPASLDEGERARAATFTSEPARRSYITSHAFLRQVLAVHLAVDPTAIRYERHCEHCGHPTHGRPRLVGRGLSFSLSHSGPHVVVAVTDGGGVDGLVGADVEDAARRPVAEGVIRRVCTTGEQRWLLDQPAANRPMAFLGLWTRKEAVAKALGLGLVLPFDSFEVLGSEPVRPRPGAPELVTHAIDLPRAVVAVAVAPGTVVRRSERQRDGSVVVAACWTRRTPTRTPWRRRRSSG